MKGFADKVADDVIKAAQCGEVPALKQLYELYANKVLRLVSGMLGSVEDGQDLTQEIFIKVFNRLPELQNVSAFPGWLKQLSVRMAIDQLRLKTDWLSADTLELIEASSDWLQACDLLTQLDDIEILMRVLTAPERALVWLFVVEGYRHEEVATLMATSETVVRQRYRRAMLKLKATLSRQVKDEQ